MENDRLGRLVHQRRLALDLSQRDAAVRARISNQTWLNVEAGRGANERSLVRIERALELAGRHHRGDPRWRRTT